MGVQDWRMQKKRLVSGRDYSMWIIKLLRSKNNVLEINFIDNLCFQLNKHDVFAEHVCLLFTFPQFPNHGKMDFNVLIHHLVDLNGSIIKCSNEANNDRPKCLSPKCLSPKWLSPKWLSPKWLSPKWISLSLLILEMKICPSYSKL